MNGRLYDPKLHRFLQPDNYVQDPGNTQNYNRYGYCVNNPLKYIDINGEKFRLTWSDVFAGASILAGTALAIFGGPAGAALGTKLIVAGATHFLATTAIVVSSGKSWVDASNYVGFQSPTISINTDWGYNNDKKNGITQTEPVITPYSNISSKTKEDNTENNGGLLGGLLSAYQWYNKHTTLNFKADLGFDFLRFKGYHYGIPEFETSFLNGQGAITPGSFALYPTGGASNPSYSTHEPGHALQYQILGRYYYPLIALPSIINTKLNWRIFDYTEKSANTLWYIYTGEHDRSNEMYFFDVKKMKN